MDNVDRILAKAFRLLMKVTKLRSTFTEHFGEDTSLPVEVAMEDFIDYVQESSSKWQNVDVDCRTSLENEMDRKYEIVIGLMKSLFIDVERCRQIILEDIN